MATNRDKFLELRKSGVDPITARKQSYWEIPAIANAPVAWVAPAITPIAPAPTTPIDNKQVLANNQAKVAWEIQAGTRPAVWQQSESLAPPTWTTTPSGATLNADWTVTNAPPVNATANPTTPAPTATPTTATASNTATWAVDFNVWAGREQDIVKNLQTFKTQGMDDNAIKQASGYATADATKKAQIDGFLAGQNKPLDEGTVFNAMMAWTPPPIQNTPDYRSAKYRYDQFQKFNGMTVPQLVDNLKQGEITTEMNNLLAQNPNYQLAKQEMQAYQNTQNINNAVNGFSSGINGKEIDTPDYLQALSDKILTKLGLSETSAQQAFKDIVTNDSKVVDYTNQLSAINRQVADTTKLLNDGYKDLKAQYGDMPSSALITLMNSRFSTANDTLANLNNSKSYLEADLKNAVEMARGEYEAAAQDIQNQNTIRNNLINQATQAQFNSLQSQQEFDRQQNAPSFQQIGDKVYKVQNWVMTDTWIATEKWASFQVIGDKVYKVKWDSITEVPWISALSSTKPTSEWKVIWKNPDGSDKYGFVDVSTTTVLPYTWEATWDLRSLAEQFPGQAWAKNNNPAWITWNANFDNWTGTAKLLTDAWVKFSKWTPRPSWEGGNYVTFPTIEDGLKAQQIIMTQTYGNSTVQNMLASWVWTWEGANYAKQVAWMAGITDLNQKVSSLTPDQISKLQMAKIQKESPWLYGLLTKPATEQVWEQYSDQNIADLAYITELQEKNPTQAAKDMKELGYTPRDVANYKAWNVPLTEKQKTTSTELMSDIADLVHNYDYTDATGIHFFDEAARGSDWENANTKIENIVSKLTLPSLWMLKWPMSDKDLAFIKAASNNLATTQSDASFEKQLIKAYNLAARRAGKPEITKLSEIKNDVETELANSF